MTEQPGGQGPLDNQTGYAAGGAGQWVLEIHARNARPDETRDGHRTNDNHGRLAVAGEAGHTSLENHDPHAGLAILCERGLVP